MSKKRKAEKHVFPEEWHLDQYQVATIEKLLVLADGGGYVQIYPGGITRSQITVSVQV